MADWTDALAGPRKLDPTRFQPFAPKPGDHSCRSRKPTPPPKPQRLDSFHQVQRPTGFDVAGCRRHDRGQGAKKPRANSELILTRDGSGMRTTEPVTLWLQCPMSNGFTLRRYTESDRNLIDPAVRLGEGVLYSKNTGTCCATTLHQGSQLILKVCVSTTVQLPKSWGASVTDCVRSKEMTGRTWIIMTKATELDMDGIHTTGKSSGDTLLPKVALVEIFCNQSSDKGSKAASAASNILATCILPNAGVHDVSVVVTYTNQ